MKYLAYTLSNVVLYFFAFPWVLRVGGNINWYARYFEWVINQ
jgi:hypothetical protein